MEPLQLFSEADTKRYFKPEDISKYFSEGK